MSLKYYIFFIFTLFSSFCYSQNITEAAARAELQKRGYDETRFREELNKKGVNIDNVDPNNAVEVAKVEKAVKEVMEILDKEKNAQKSSEKMVSPPTTSNQPPAENTTRSADNAVLNQSKDIQKAVKDGATIEEAVTEKIQEIEKTKAPEPITYGQHVFRDKSIALFRSSTDVKPTKSYVLGPGDKIAISIWGPTQENFAEEISRDGFIQPTGISRIYLGGLTVDAAEKLLYAKLRTKYYFQKENFDIQVTTARTINVNIVGEVFNNGSFNISAINTAFNALVAAGGPNNIGSVRNIQIRRPGSKKNIILDVYKFLQDPIVSQDYYLRENDYIYVPVSEKLVTISGAINRSFRYELLPNEHLTELIKYAGGLKSNALKGNIKVTRIENDSVRIIDVNLYDIEKRNGNFNLLNGDIVEISTIGEQIRNEISISGAVENPGKYALNDNFRISDLLKKAILKDNAFTSVAYVKRLNVDGVTIRYALINLDNIIINPSSADNITFQRGDELIISSLSNFVDIGSVTIEGAIREPKKFPLDRGKDLKVADAIFFAGGLKPDAADFAYVLRPDKTDKSVIEYIYLNVKDIINNPNTAENINLEPNDRLITYLKSSYSDASIVTVSGAVRKGGQFAYSPSLKIRDLILLGGGLRQDAALDRIDVYRISVGDGKSTRILTANLRLNEQMEIQNNGGSFDLKPFDQVYIRTAPEYELQRNITVVGEVRYPGDYTLMGDNSKLTSVITSAGGVTDEAFLKGATLLRKEVGEVGYIIINLEKALKSPSSPENVILQKGDIITIPKLHNIVTISGAIRIKESYRGELSNQEKIQTPYFKGKSAKFYINEYAGGLSKDADMKKIMVIDANGKVTKAKRFFGISSYPIVSAGSDIIVGVKDVKPIVEKDKDEVKWGDVLANSVAQATTILSLILLIQNVN